MPVAPAGKDGISFAGVVIEELEEDEIADILQQDSADFVPDAEEPLRISKIKISPTGVLKLSFSKPILPISFSGQDKSSKSRDLRKKEAFTID